MTRPRTPRRLLLASLPVILALSLGGVAYAYSSGSGGGTGSATTGTTVAVILSEGAAAGDLYPGGQADVVVEMSNPNTFSVRVDSLVLDTGLGFNGFTASSCAAADAALSFTTPQTSDGAPWDVPAKVDTTNGTLTVTLRDALMMGAGAASDCQGSAFTVHVAAAGP
jgi:hypothetical protein